MRPCDYLLDRAEVGQRVIIIGGGLTGCEIALDLYQKGKTPVIVEMKNDLIAVKGVCLANSSYLRDFFALHEVEVHLETALAEITDTGVLVRGVKDGRTFPIDGDTVLLSVGYQPAPLAPASKQGHSSCRRLQRRRQPAHRHLWRAWDVAMKL